MWVWAPDLMLFLVGHINRQTLHFFLVVVVFFWYPSNSLTDDSYPKSPTNNSLTLIPRKVRDRIIGHFFLLIGVGELSAGESSVGESSVEELSVGELTENQFLQYKNIR